MNIDEIKNNLPAQAKDIKLNLQTLLTEEGAPDLTLNQIYGVALSAAYTSKNQNLIEALLATNPLTDKELSATKAAAIIMAMNNIYYRFTHLVNNHEYDKLPAKLRMNIMANPEVDKKDFELFSLAVSAINGCGKCIEAHEKELKKAGVTTLAIQSAIRIAAVIHATAFSLSIN